MGQFREEEGGWSLRVVRDSYEVGLRKTISKQWDFFNTKVSFPMGSGSKMKFWKDSWYNEKPLFVLFSSLFALSDSKEMWIDDFWKYSVEEWNKENCDFEERIRQSMIKGILL